MQRRLFARAAIVSSIFLAGCGLNASAAILTDTLTGTITAVGPGTPVGLTVGDAFSVVVTRDGAFFGSGFTGTLMPGDPGYSVTLMLPTVSYTADTDDDIEFGLFPDVPGTTYVGGAIAGFDFVIVNDYNAGGPVGETPWGDPMTLGDAGIGAGDILVDLFDGLAIFDVTGTGVDPEGGLDLVPIEGALIASGEFDAPLAVIPIPPAAYFLGSALVVLLGRRGGHSGPRDQI